VGFAWLLEGPIETTCCPTSPTCCAFQAEAEMTRCPVWYWWKLETTVDHHPRHAARKWLLLPNTSHDPGETLNLGNHDSRSLVGLEANEALAYAERVRSFRTETKVTRLTGILRHIVSWEVDKCQSRQGNLASKIFSEYARMFYGCWNCLKGHQK
jgi:hypothetical protein